MALKDIIHTTDMHTTGGALAFEGFTPPYEATLTRNLEDAGAIISLVKSSKYEMPRKLDHVEHHPLGSQAFVPLDETPFIVVVGKAGESPQPEDFQGFITNGQQGINYHPGTWHHVLLTPYAAMTFLCIDRAGPGNNCIDHFFDEDQQRVLALP